MKKVFNLVLGGIQHKVFNLVLATTLFIMIAYSVVILHQSRGLTRLVEEAGQEQLDSINGITSQTMQNVVEQTLGRSVQLESYITDTIFADIEMDVQLLRDYAEELYAHPNLYSLKQVEAPQASRDGEVSTQLLTEEGVDVDNVFIRREIGLLGNMTNMMESLLLNEDHLGACYIGTPSGVLIITDEDSASKLSDTGEPNHYQVTERYWYKEALEKKDISFTKVAVDLFTGKVNITCACPVYIDGELAAVIGADLFLDELEESINASASDAGFEVILDEFGHVLFSPEESGVFAVFTTDQAQDLRESDNAGLAAFVKEALEGPTDVQQIDINGKSYYLVGAPMKTVGWSIVSVVDKAATDAPATMMIESFNDISANAVSAYDKSIADAKRTLIVLLLIIFVITTASALYVGKRIVTPLEVMTKRMKMLSAHHKLFQMEDAYRTGDEVQVLAEAFADLSKKTVKYVKKIQEVTAEKERISAELSMANAIQTSQLPQIFPPYPDRKEFDLYASMTPAREVGGDFYDFFLVDHDHVGLVMADVSGKGVPAALFMMIAKTLIKNRVQSGESPAAALSNVNEQLLEGNEASMFVTVWLCVLTLSTGRGVAANAGHEHPALRRRGGQYELVKYRHSPAMGTMDDIPFREHEFQLNPGDSFFVYTDGVAEAMNADNQLYGTDRMLEALNKNPDAHPRQVLLDVMQGIDEFTEGVEQFDDITMLCLKYNGPVK